MIAAGDRIAVGVSGGKDSYTLLDCLLALRRKSPVRFELQALVVDQGFPGFEVEVIEGFLAARGVPFRVETVDTAREEDLYGVEGGSFCSFCAKHRRGVLYRTARAMGCNKIALGHHQADVVETLLMNMIFNGTLKGMPARLAGTGEGSGMELIRPLVYVPEDLIREHAAAQAYPTILCMCPTCGTTLQRRRWLKTLLDGIEAEAPGARRNMLRSMQNVEAQQMLLTEDGRAALIARLGGTPQAGAPPGPDPFPGEALPV